MSERDERFAWRAGSATGIGSMPGTDVAEACRVVFGELPDLPYLPELPERGPGADLTGRTAALLVDLPVQVVTRGWQLVRRRGRDASRAASYWSRDLDTLEEMAAGYAGPLKIQVCGPWTLAATLELTYSVRPALADPGAVADLSISLAEGVAAHAAEVRKRVPAATLVVQLDEPSLPAVLAGQVATPSGLGTFGAVDRSVVIQRLAEVVSAPAAATVVHCCGRAADTFLEMKDAGATAVSFDLDQLPVRETDRVAELAEAGLGLFVGAVPTDALESAASRRGVVPPVTARQTAEKVVGLWRRTGLSPGLLAEQVVVTPACGLAQVSPAAARAALEHCREAARIAVEMVEEISR